MRILVTGSRGFIGKNLVSRLRENREASILEFNREDPEESLDELVSASDFVAHLAGENRPSDPESFRRVNVRLTERLCKAIERTGSRVGLILASSTQAPLDNAYGRSKRAAERVVEQFAERTSAPVAIYRLPGVFGKWCKPNYNSVVATFCHNIANGLPIRIDDPETKVRLVYIDDVVDAFLGFLSGPRKGVDQYPVSPEYTIALGDLAAQINAFENFRTKLMAERVGTGLVRALYSTYLSYLPPSKFIYDLARHGDERGVFTEMLKTPDCGQFSYFTAHPGVTRGGHYHHSKTEKFLVIKGKARFGFRHISTGESYEIFTSDAKPQVVESVPGWTHDITNIGKDEMIVMLWANEIYDADRPDTIACKV